MVTFENIVRPRPIITNTEAIWTQSFKVTFHYTGLAVTFRYYWPAYT